MGLEFGAEILALAHQSCGFQSPEKLEVIRGRPGRGLGTEWFIGELA